VRCKLQDAHFHLVFVWPSTCARDRARIARSSRGALQGYVADDGDERLEGCATTYNGYTRRSECDARAWLSCVSSYCMSQ